MLQSACVHYSFPWRVITFDWIVHYLSIFSLFHFRRHHFSPRSTFCCGQINYQTAPVIECSVDNLSPLPTSLKDRIAHFDLPKEKECWPNASQCRQQCFWSNIISLVSHYVGNTGNSSSASLMDLWPLNFKRHTKQDWTGTPNNTNQSVQQQSTAVNDFDDVNSLSLSLSWAGHSQLHRIAFYLYGCPFGRWFMYQQQPKQKQKLPPALAPPPSACFIYLFCCSLSPLLILMHHLTFPSLLCFVPLFCRRRIRTRSHHFTWCSAAAACTHLHWRLTKLFIGRVLALSLLALTLCLLATFSLSLFFSVNGHSCARIGHIHCCCCCCCCCWLHHCWTLHSTAVLLLLW